MCFKKALLVLAFGCFTLLSVFAEGNNKKVPAEYIQLRTTGDSMDLETGALDAYLKTRLVQSPFFDLKPTQPDIMIHGVISNESRDGKLYRLTVFVTDFDQNKELQAASVKLLSLSSFEFAIDQIVVQLEGREAVIYGQSNLSIDTDDLASSRIKMPRMRGFDKREKEMAKLLETNLKEGQYLLSKGQYAEAEAFFENYIENFEQTLTDDYQESMEKYSELAEELMDESRNLSVLQQTSQMTMEAENYILAGAFEQALELYIEAEEIIDDLGDSPQCEKFQDSINETIDELEELCEGYIQALFDELTFNISWYGFQGDETGIQNSFIQFHNYASESRYLSDFKGDYNDLVSDYSERFSTLEVPELQ